jgi:prevent-host-death family protein
MRTEVASRELRNNTAGLLRRVQAGEEIVITARGKPVAALVGAPGVKRRWLSRGELIQRLEATQADAGLRADLKRLAGDTTDDLDAIA